MVVGRAEGSHIDGSDAANNPDNTDQKGRSAKYLCNGYYRRSHELGCIGYYKGQANGRYHPEMKYDELNILK